MGKHDFIRMCDEDGLRAAWDALEPPRKRKSWQCQPATSERIKASVRGATEAARAVQRQSVLRSFALLPPVFDFMDWSGARCISLHSAQNAMKRMRKAGDIVVVGKSDPDSGRRRNLYALSDRTRQEMEAAGL